jgi:hypothetical protein
MPILANELDFRIGRFMTEPEHMSRASDRCPAANTFAPGANLTKQLPFALGVAGYNH